MQAMRRSRFEPCRGIEFIFFLLLVACAAIYYVIEVGHTVSLDTLNIMLVENTWLVNRERKYIISVQKGLEE